MPVLARSKTPPSCGPSSCEGPQSCPRVDATRSSGQEFCKMWWVWSKIIEISGHPKLVM